VRKVGELFVNGGMFSLLQENLGKFFLDGKNVPQICAKQSAEERIFTPIRKIFSHI
jgi:hypothetical protein